MSQVIIRGDASGVTVEQNGLILSGSIRDRVIAALARNAERRETADRVLKLKPGELSVVSAILDRLDIGRKRYGALDPNDGHDWRKEAEEEVLDACVYLACKVIKEGK